MQRFSGYLMKVGCEHASSLVDAMLEGFKTYFPLIIQIEVSNPRFIKKMLKSNLKGNNKNLTPESWNPNKAEICINTI